MPYFPESHAGDYWNQALTNIGQNIAQSIQFYRKRHEELQQKHDEFEELHQLGVIDEKSYQRISAHTGTERASLEAAHMQAMQDAASLDKAYSDINKSILSDRYGQGFDIVYDEKGNPYAQRDRRTGRLLPIPKRPGTPEEPSQKALDSHANKTVASWGHTGAEFKNRTDEETGNVPLDSTGKPDFSDPKKFTSGAESAKKRTFGGQPIEAPEQNAVRFKIGDKTLIAPKSDFEIVRKVYPRKGDPGYQEPTKVGQPQPGSAIKYPVGTWMKTKSDQVWHIRTDKGWDPPLGSQGQSGTQAQAKQQQAAIGSEEDAGTVL